MDGMAKGVKELSTEKLKSRIKTATILMTVCWSAVLVAVAVTLAFGKSPFILSANMGFLGLAVASMAMGIGIKQAKEELARRDKDNQTELSH